MTHVRQQVRAAFVSRLSAISGIRRFVGARAHALARSDLPAIQVITPQETIQPLDYGDVETDRRMTVEVTVYDMPPGDMPDDALDAVAAQIEALIMTATGAPWDDLVLHFPSSAQLTIGDAAEEPLLSLTTRFDVRLSATDPETIGA